MHGMSDEALYSLWRAGDRKSGHILAQRYYRNLHRYFHKRVRRCAEDLVQQTLLSVLHGRSPYRGEASFRSFLFCAARRHMLSYVKRSKREGSEGEPWPAELLVHPEGPQAQPAESAWLAEALVRIPDELRGVLQLAYWEGLTALEIANASGVPLNTVYSRLRRAKAHLRREHDNSEFWRAAIECSPSA